MFVGVARFVLQIPGSRSLKDRRRVVKSFKDRVRARLPVSVAEIGDLELYQVATLGVVVVAAQSGRVTEVLSHAKSMAASLSGALLAIEDVLDPGVDSQFEWGPDTDPGDEYKDPKR
jgi:uncharacterized protein YlxP (DUF503 family)